jgi:hypothetical protein
LGCIFSSFMYGLMMSTSEFSSDDPGEDMVALDFEVEIWQKQIEMKTRRENDIWTSRNLGDYIAESLTTKGRHRMKLGRKRAPRRPHHLVARPGGGPRHEVVWCPRAPFPTRLCLVIFHI